MSSFDLLFSEKTILRSHTDSDGLCTLRRWSQSSTKRWFDLACILSTLPIWLPVLRNVRLHALIIDRSQRSGTLIRHQPSRAV